MATCTASARADDQRYATTGSTSSRKTSGTTASSSSSPATPAAICGRAARIPRPNKMTRRTRRASEAFWNATDLRVGVGDRRPAGVGADLGGRGAAERRRRLLRRLSQLLSLRPGPEGAWSSCPKDTDSTFDWLAVFDLPGAADHPVFWWEGRAPARADAGPALADRDVGRQLAEELRGRDRDAARALGRGQLQAWIDAWSQQIAADVRGRSAQRGRRSDNFNVAVAQAREIVADARRLPAHVRRLRAERERRRHGRRRRALVRRLPRRRRHRSTSARAEMLQRRRRQLQRDRRRRLPVAPGRAGDGGAPRSAAARVSDSYGWSRGWRPRRRHRCSRSRRPWSPAARRTLPSRRSGNGSRCG